MAEAIFNYNGMDTRIQCKKEEKMKDICEKFGIKMQADINKLIFIYGGGIINMEIKYEELGNEIDKENKQKRILVYDNNTNVEEKRMIESKDVICPRCGEICMIDFREYKVILEKCRNNHENRIKMDEYENTQKIDENKIICKICKINNKSKSYNNKFYVCGTCEKEICLLCKEKHNKDHIIMDYENKNYICNKHNEVYSAYCEKCKENLCIQCQFEHNKNDKIISYMDIKPDRDNIENKLKEIK